MNTIQNSGLDPFFDPFLTPSPSCLLFLDPFSFSGGLANVAAVAAGRACCLAVSGGLLVGWGDTNSPETTIPVATNVVAVSAGADFGLALKSGGAVIALQNRGSV